MDHEEEVEEGQNYARDVAADRIVASRWVRLACERHLQDLDLAESGGHPRGFYFDAQDAADALAVFGWVRFFKGVRAGQTFKPAPWQVFIVISLFGWKMGDGSRKFRKGHIEVAKKNGKSTFAAVLLIILAFFDGEAGAEVYTAATSRFQARIVFDTARTLVMKSDILRRKIRVLAHVLSRPDLQQKLQAVSSEAGNLDGLDIHAAVIDELHRHATSNVLKVLELGTTARIQPLILIITTAGPGNDPTNPCRLERDKATAVLDRFVAGEGWESDDELFVYIACLDTQADGAEDDDDWKDPDTWIKANPNLGAPGAPSVKKLQSLVESATPTEVPMIQRLHMNLWVGSARSWIPAEKWSSCSGPVDPSALEGRLCYGALDLSTTTDLSALVLYFPRDEGPAPVLAYAWLPQDRLRFLGGRDAAPYPVWIEQGWLRSTEGDVVDYRTLRRDINVLGNTFDIRAIAYDPYRAMDLAVNLKDDGFTLVKMPQTYAGLHVATTRTTVEILRGQIAHGGNPVLSWCVGNAVLEENDSGLVKLSRKKSRDKIDLAVALVMAVGWWATAGEAEGEESKYNDPNVNFEAM